MDTEHKDLSLEESIKIIVPQLPKPIQQFFLQDKVEDVARVLMQEYRLHADQANIVEREIVMLLLGIRGPDELGKNLAQETGLPAQTVNALISSLNERVLTPIDNEMRAQAQPVAQKPVTSAVPPALPQQPRPTQVPAMPAPQAPIARPRPVSVPPPNLPGAPKMPDDRLLEAREEPHIELRPTAPADPRPAPQPVSQPVMPPAAPTTPAIAPVAPPIVKQYAADPYREPIDEG